jgi:hypothetical protein
MDEQVISPIRNLLPGALSKWILGASILLSGSLLIGPSYDIPAKYITDTELIKLLIRLLSAGIPLLIGTIALVALLMYHNKKLTDSSNVKIDFLIDKCAHLMAQVNIHKEYSEKYQALAERTISTSQQTISDLKKQLETTMSRPFEEWNK